MRDYDPLQAPEPAEWLAMDEPARIDLILDYHLGQPTKLPSPRLHAAIHAVVETQVAMADEIPVAGTLARLMAEGLDRHEALHAIGSVLMRHMHGVMVGSVADADPNAAYGRELEALGAESWRQANPEESR